MGGTELVYNLFSECVTAGPSHEGLCAINPVAAAAELSQSIGVALIVKGVLTIVTFGIKLPAGIFIPTLGVGACFGRMLGIGVQYLQLTHPDLSMFEACRGDADCVIPGLYAMVRSQPSQNFCAYDEPVFRLAQLRHSRGLRFDFSYYILDITTNNTAEDDGFVGSNNVRAHGHPYLCRPNHALDLGGEDSG